MKMYRNGADYFMKIMVARLVLFMKSFLLCAIIGCTIDFFLNGFQIVISDLISDLVFDLFLALITVSICGETTQKMDVNDAMKFLRDNSLDVLEDENAVVGVLNKYRQFFMGNLQYDKKREILRGPKIIVKNDSKIMS